MTAKEREQNTQKLMRGLEIAEYRMLKDKALRNEVVIQGDDKGGYKAISARVLFARLYPQEAAML